MTARKKIPLDKLLVQQGHAPDITTARACIMAGDVVVDDHLVDKPGTAVLPDSRVRLKKKHGRYVSRGGEKLAGPLEVFQIGHGLKQPVNPLDRVESADIQNDGFIFTKSQTLSGGRRVHGPE